MECCEVETNEWDGNGHLKLEDRREEREEIGESDNEQQQLSWIGRREGEV